MRIRLRTSTGPARTAYTPALGGEAAPPGRPSICAQSPAAKMSSCDTHCSVGDTRTQPRSEVATPRRASTAASDCASAPVAHSTCVAGTSRLGSPSASSTASARTARTAQPCSTATPRSRSAACTAARHAGGSWLSSSAPLSSRVTLSRCLPPSTPAHRACSK